MFVIGCQEERPEGLRDGFAVLSGQRPDKVMGAVVAFGSAVISSSQARPRERRNQGGASFENGWAGILVWGRPLSGSKISRRLTEPLHVANFSADNRVI